MIIVKGKYGGFCFGVSRAITEAQKLRGEGNYVLGEIIHNESVISKLNEQGIITINNLEQIDISSAKNLLIRTHGEPKSIYEKAKRIGINVIDCTCPFVREIQQIVEKHYNAGYKIAIIGKAEHPEIIGINGWCNGSAIITEDERELSNIVADKLCIVVQTTYSEEKLNKINKKIVAFFISSPLIYFNFTPTL